MIIIMVFKFEMQHWRIMKKIHWTNHVKMTRYYIQSRKKKRTTYSKMKEG
jgi:hypothetical protein